jgi:hypothetical protein
MTEKSNWPLTGYSHHVGPSELFTGPKTRLHSSLMLLKQLYQLFNGGKKGLAMRNLVIRGLSL